MDCNRSKSVISNRSTSTTGKIGTKSNNRLPLRSYSFLSWNVNKVMNENINKFQHKSKLSANKAIESQVNHRNSSIQSKRGNLSRTNTHVSTVSSSLKSKGSSRNSRSVSFNKNVASQSPSIIFTNSTALQAKNRKQNKKNSGLISKLKRCPYCYRYFPASSIDHHIHQQCPLVVLICELRDDYVDNFNKSRQVNDEEKGIVCGYKTKCINSMIEHQSRCKYKKVNCPNDKCDCVISLRSLAKHIERDCLYQEVLCNDCNSFILKKDMDDHQVNCLHKIIPCPLLCGVNIKRAELNNHLDSMDIEHHITALHAAISSNDTNGPLNNTISKDTLFIFRYLLNKLKQDQNTNKEDNQKIMRRKSNLKSIENSKTPLRSISSNTHGQVHINSVHF